MEEPSMINYSPLSTAEKVALIQHHIDRANVAIQDKTVPQDQWDGALEEYDFHIRKVKNIAKLIAI